MKKTALQLLLLVPFNGINHPWLALLRRAIFVFGPTGVSSLCFGLFIYSIVLCAIYLLYVYTHGVVVSCLLRLCVCLAMKLSRIVPRVFVLLWCPTILSTMANFV